MPPLWKQMCLARAVPFEEPLKVPPRRHLRKLVLPLFVVTRPISLGSGLQREDITKVVITNLAQRLRMFRRQFFPITPYDQHATNVGQPLLRGKPPAWGTDVTTAMQIGGKKVLSAI